jgi:DNA-binding transcriptional regulator YbjK
MSEPARRKRDPEARRAAIVAATAELITEVGVDAITHRMVAARADVPLGATTQYFATLDELRDAALQLLAAHMTERTNQMRDELAKQGASSAVITELVVEGLADARAMHVDRAIVTAAIHDPKLREMAAGWSEQIVEVLEPKYGRERACAATIFIDGILSRTMVTGSLISPNIIQAALADLLGETDR